MRLKIYVFACTILFAFLMSFAENKTENALFESYGLALKNAKQDKKPVFVIFYADWCVPCRVMDANVFTDINVQKLLQDNFHTVRLSVDEKKEVLCDGKKLTVKKCAFEQLQLRGVPSFAIFDDNGISMLTFEGAFDVKSFTLFLNKLLN